MSRFYSGQANGATSRLSAAEEQARIRQQNRVLAWVVGSAVAMHLLVVVGVMWLAWAQVSAQAQQLATVAPSVHKQRLPAEPATSRTREAHEHQRPEVAVQVAPGMQTVHWSASLSKDRPAPWHVDARGHVVSR